MIPVISPIVLRRCSVAPRLEPMGRTGYPKDDVG